MGAKILIVDDEEDILDLVDLSLTADGFDVITARSGPEALEKVREEMPDLILLDISMPDMDGYEVMRRLKGDRRTSSIPIIMLTAASDKRDKVRSFSAGADDYVVKPFDADELTARIEAVLSRTRTIRYINPLISTMGDWSVEELGSSLETAVKIQRNLLPKEPPDLEGIQFGNILESSRTVSGDFYDYIPLDQYRVGIAIADIRGKGLPASLLMVMVRTILRLVSRELDSPGDVLKKINDMLQTDTDPEFFATMIYGILDTRSLTFRYANGGHCSPIRANERSRKVEFLREGGLILGVFDFALFEDVEVELEDGDLLLFYTDGVTETESPGGDIYGEERLAGFIRDHLYLSADELCRAIRDELYDFSGTYQRADDMTIVAIKITD
ncbi:SpoIIE family protein phosphatase [Candidatus Poribacteria bacterium]|nr:SpoIIE family protein phosphatase [Candidatus Poribacteria bacterium]